MKRIAILGGGIAGLTAAWELERARAQGADLSWRLFEATGRLGGIIETHHQSGFTIECGPDGWVSEKRAARDLAVELGLASELLHSQDATRKTYLLLNGQLTPLPDGLRMMVPTNLAAIDDSPLFSPAAKAAFHAEPTRAAELRAAAPAEDESIASFIRRHFGDEVLRKVGAPLLAGVFGGDVGTLSVRAVMAPFVALEREFGSLITALERRRPATEPIFTTLGSGLGSLVDRLTAALPPESLHVNVPIAALTHTSGLWQLHPQVPAPETSVSFDELILATPAHVTQSLLRPLAPYAASLIPTEASSAIVVALAFEQADLHIPPGFGFLVPASPASSLLACTFADQKYPTRVPPGGQLLRAFFGASSAARLSPLSNQEITALALTELRHVLGPLPLPAFTVLRRWPRSLPQYAVGHLDRVRELFSLITEELPGLTLLGNPFLGVGLPDLVRDARAAGRRIATGEVF